MAVKYFEIDGVKLKLEYYKLYYWFDTSGGRKVNKPKWREKKLTKSRSYLVTRINKKNYLFHRIVYYAYNQDWNIKFIKDNTIDHIDRNTLNNNIFNLKIATQSEQNFNREFKNVKGYYYFKRDKKYLTKILLNSEHIYLGCYDSEQEAFNKAKKVKLFINVLKKISERKSLNNK
jgi:hypothetical protein